MWHCLYFSCSLCTSKKMKNKDNGLKHSYKRKKTFYMNKCTKSSMLGSLRHPIDKAGSITSFSSKEAFPKISLSSKKVKRFIDDNDSKEMKIMLTSQDECRLVDQQKKINKTDNDSAS